MSCFDSRSISLIRVDLSVQYVSEHSFKGFQGKSQGARTSGDFVCSKYNEMYGKILKSLTIVKLYRGMSKLKVEINVNLPQLLCIVVSVALNGESERFGGFYVDCYYTL